MSQLSNIFTRERVWNDICAKIANPHERIAQWCRTTVVEMTPDAEWARLHAGVCMICGGTARKYPMGWACDQHRPGGTAVTAGGAR